MSEAKARPRFLKTIRISYNDVQKGLIDDKVNALLSTIASSGAKVVSITTDIFGIGVNPVYLIYSIIYEPPFGSSTPLESEIFEGKE